MEAAASTDVEALKEFAEDYEREDDYDNAIIEYTKAIQIAPNDAELYKMRGNARFFVGLFCDETEMKAKYRLSIQDYSEIIRLNPNDDESYIERAWLYWALEDGEEEKAIDDCDSALKINPNNASAYSLVAAICKSMELYPLAIQWFTRALNIKKSAYIFWDRGETYEATGDSSNAYVDFVKAANLRPYYWGKLGHLYQEQGKLRQAINAYTKKINVEPDTSAYRSRADTYRELENNEAALTDYTRAIYLIAEYDSGRAKKVNDEDLAELYNVRGDINKALENFDQAKSDYKKALRLAPGNGEARELFDGIE